MSSQQATKDSDEGGDNLVTRSVHVDKEVWELAKQKAKRSNLSLSSIVRQLLKAWVEGRIRITIDDETK
jgi:hypothetical protein